MKWTVVRPGLVALLLIVAAGAPLAAQRGTPEADARDLLQRRTPAFDATQTLMSNHRLTAEESVDLLTRAGFARADVALATVRNLTREPARAVSGLRAAGYSAIEVQNAFAGAGGLLDMTCFDPQGYPVVCSAPGSTPVMGQLTLVPAAEAFTDSILTITGTNIPPLDVYLAGMRLDGIDATSGRIRVRAPSAPVTGDLVIRRPDGVEGLLRSQYVIAPLPLNVDWQSIGQLTVAAAAVDVALWAQAARIATGRCMVVGGLATGEGGVVESTGFTEKIRAALTAAGLPAEIASGWDSGFRLSWGIWAAGTGLPALPWYPSFATYPGASAPPTANVPTPLALLVSANLGAMTPSAIAARIVGEIGPQNDVPGLGAAVQAFAATIATRFAVWLGATQVAHVMGSGTVPTYSPGTGVLAGPVQGTCAGEGILVTPGF